MSCLKSGNGMQMGFMGVEKIREMSLKYESLIYVDELNNLKTSPLYIINKYFSKPENCFYSPPLADDHPKCRYN